ncbi:hypothetical protein [Nocardioides sp.]|uniref:hypothetical protein n=1 Tax=Nocardioides sp. TaxID=35761 RepID=UPI003511CDC0
MAALIHPRIGGGVARYPVPNDAALVELAQLVEHCFRAGKPVWLPNVDDGSPPDATEAPSSVLYRLEPGTPLGFEFDHADSMRRVEAPGIHDVTDVIAAH